ncbi:hypothetical protein [Ramlibacter sp.]|uniref:hypothetical protein n=1 Tax=Ramlibacter sp. TaxID=1917967 RepID=UPI001794B3EA|nr:hypothetical protein [Ramlibacter sp.]MBA2674353.1 hypothetical protein [Ramlibacter sp.]
MELIETRTPSILERVPKILAVTAASYGLSLQPRTVREGPHIKKAGSHKPTARSRSGARQ